ncbi:MAG: site-specific integrase, partial [candidate division WOR-3 bacterium]
IKHMMTKAVHWGSLLKNPLRSVTKLKEPPGRVRYLTTDEISRLLYCCPQHIKPIVITALNTGMRKGEILGLKWEDVDLIKRVILVRDSKNHRSRHIPINDILYAELLRLPHGPTDCEHVFVGKGNKPIRSIQNAWERALKAAGIVNFRFHDLRHTFASYLAMNGHNIRDIQELLGQKTILMTIRYSHLSNEVLRRAVDTLNLGQCQNCEVGTNMAQAATEKA